MGVIQGAINQTLGTSAAAAYLGRSLSEGVGAKIAEEKVPEIKEETEQLKSQAADIEKSIEETRASEEQAYINEQIEKHVNVPGTVDVDEIEAIARRELVDDPEVSEQVYGRSRALKAQLDAIQGKIQQNQDIQVRLEEVNSGKLKKTKSEVEKIMGGKK